MISFWVLAPRNVVVGSSVSLDRTASILELKVTKFDLSLMYNSDTNIFH